MHLVSFYIDSAERTCRTKVLASSAAYADLGVDYRNAENLTLIYWLTLCINPFAFLIHLVRFVNRHHLDSPTWAFACTVTAGLTVSYRYAVLLHPNGMTYLNSGLFLNGDRTNGTCWAYLRASCAFWTAIALLIFHYRLKESVEREIWTQNAIRAVAYAELTTRAFSLQITC
jgi:hypothetical protein